MYWLEHIGIIVSDLERSTRFFGALFNSVPIERAEWRGKNAEYVATLAGRPGLRLDCVFFQIPYTNTILELAKYSDIQNQPTGAHAPEAIGGMHLAFFVEDFDEAIERLKQIGATIMTPVDILHGPYTGGRTVYCRDPDNTLLQLMAVTQRPGRLPVLRPSAPLPKF